MKYLGLMYYFLGLEVLQIPKNIFLNQGKYAVEILKRFDMLECKIHEYTHGNEFEAPS
jgi:hypothetical protein